MRMNPPFKLAVNVSGGGSTYQAIAHSCATPGLALHGLFEVACLVASHDDIGAIEKAEAFGMERGKNIYVIHRRDFPSAEAFGRAMIDTYARHDIDVYSQNGWILLTPQNVVERYLGINQHPGIPELFGGKGMRGMAVHQAVLNYCQMSGKLIHTEAVAHLVTPRYDEGAVIMAQKVEVCRDDTAATLQKRVLAVEHVVQIEALVKMASYIIGGFEGRLAIDRDIPILSDAERHTLERAKTMAIESYPNG